VSGGANQWNSKCRNGFNMYRIKNRAAVVVTPKQPFLDWLHRCPDPVHYRTIDELVEQIEGNIYFIPEFELYSEAEEYIQDEYYAVIFAIEVTGWYNDKTLWPRLEGYEMFKEWFDVKICTMIFDPLRGSIKKEAY
jgi:hypothetical protein